VQVHVAKGTAQQLVSGCKLLMGVCKLPWVQKIADAHKKGITVTL